MEQARTQNAHVLTVIYHVNRTSRLLPWFSVFRHLYSSWP